MTRLCTAGSLLEAGSTGIPALAAGDMNGDYQDDIFAVSAIFSLNDGLDGAVEELYALPTGSDVVVFTVIPQDVYAYRILDAPDETKIGGYAFDTNARSSGTYVHTIEYYNDHNGECTDIFVSHARGNPFSYKTTTEMAVIAKKNEGFGFYSTNNTMTTGRSDFSYTSMSTNSIDESEKSTGWEVGFKAEFRYSNKAVKYKAPVEESSDEGELPAPVDLGASAEKTP